MFSTRIVDLTVANVIVLYILYYVATIVLGVLFALAAAPAIS